MPVLNCLSECLEQITKPSFIGRPEPDTVMYVGRKFESKLKNLENVSGCLVFVETGSLVPELASQRNFIVFCDDPVWSYTDYLSKSFKSSELPQILQREYTLTSGGYYIGENVQLSTGVFIEPGALIGHDVVIGEGSIILAHAVVKYATLGKHCLIKENAQIGGQAFMMATDPQGNKKRMPCLGSVVLGDEVEVGSFTTVCRGSNTATTVEDYSKLDDHVHVGHDVHIGKNAELTAGVVLGGYDVLGDNVYIGLNATLKQLITVESGAEISMGMRITKDVKASSIMFGAPAVPNK